MTKYTISDIGTTLVHFTIDPEIAWLENVANNCTKTIDYARSLGYVTADDLFDNFPTGSDEEYTMPIHEFYVALDFLQGLCDKGVVIAEDVMSGVTVTKGD